MKKSLSALIGLFLVSNVMAQSPLTVNGNTISYDSNIVIPLPTKYGMDRTAKFIGFNYNLQANTLSIKWQVCYSKDGLPINLFGRSCEEKEQIADDRTFVDMAGNIISDTTNYQGLLMKEIDFYKMIAQRGTGGQNATINQLIIAAGMRPGGTWKD